MRETVKRRWKAGGILGGLAILVGLAADMTTITNFVSEVSGHSRTETTATSAVPTGSPPMPAKTAPSPPPPEPSPATARAESPKPQVEPPRRPTFPVKVRLDAGEALTIEGARATVSVTFHTIAGEDITTLRVLPRGGDPVSQPFLAAGGFVDFVSGGHHYRAQVVAIDLDVRAIELVIDRND